MTKNTLFKRTTYSRGANVLAHTGGLAGLPRPMGPHGGFCEPMTGDESQYSYKVSPAIEGALRIVYGESQRSILLAGQGYPTMLMGKSGLHVGETTFAIMEDDKLVPYDLFVLSKKLVTDATDTQLKKLFKLCLSSNTIKELAKESYQPTIKSEVLRLNFITGSVLSETWVKRKLGDFSEDEMNAKFTSLNFDEWYDLMYRVSPTIIVRLLHRLLDECPHCAEDDYIFVGDGTLLTFDPLVPAVSYRLLNN